MSKQSQDNALNAIPKSARGNQWCQQQPPVTRGNGSRDLLGLVQQCGFAYGYG